MTRRLTTTDRLLTSIGQFLASLDSDSPRTSTRTLDHTTAAQLRAHHAMSSAARAWTSGRRLTSGAATLTAVEPHAIDEQATALAECLDQHEAGRSLLLPAIWTGGLVAGAASQFANPRHVRRVDHDIARRSKRARIGIDALLAQAMSDNTESNIKPTVATDNAASAAEPNAPPTSSSSQQATPSATRRHQYSLRGARSPSEQLMNSFVSKACDGLFRLTRSL